MTYRVVYGETMPVWEQVFRTLREARAFARKHERLGDIVFSIERVGNADLEADNQRLRAALAHIVRACAPGVDQSDDDLDAFIAGVRDVANGALRRPAGSKA